MFAELLQEMTLMDLQRGLLRNLLSSERLQLEQTQSSYKSENIRYEG